MWTIIQCQISTKTIFGRKSNFSGGERTEMFATLYLWSPYYLLYSYSNMYFLVYRSRLAVEVHCLWSSCLLFCFHDCAGDSRLDVELKRPMKTFSKKPIVQVGFRLYESAVSAMLLLLSVCTVSPGCMHRAHIILFGISSRSRISLPSQSLILCTS